MAPHADVGSPLREIDGNRGDLLPGPGQAAAATATTPSKTPLRRTGRPAELVRVNDDEAERAQARLARRRSSAANAQARLAASLDEQQIRDLYANCIKLASENKINQKNTWGLQLIDHMHDIVKGEDEVDDTNFQKASCTLDAGVKIYSYRVDSVHAETYKVLGGLNRTAAPEEEKNNGAEKVSDDDDDDNNGSQKEKRKRGESLTPSSTLETFEALNVKRFDAACLVDPLFHKMSAQFDEGGASGLLLHNLSVYRGCELIFDSDEVIDAVPETSTAEPQDATIVLPASIVEDWRKACAAMHDKEICPTLRHIKRLLGEESAAQRVVLDVDPPSSPRLAGEASAGGPSDDEDDSDVVNPMQSSFEPIEYGDVNNVDFGDWSGPAEDQPQVAGEWSFGGGNGGAAEQTAADWLLAPLQKAPQAWAGAAHWRFRTRPPPAAAQQEQLAKPRAKKRTRCGPLIDFGNLPELPEDAFQRARRAADISLTSSRETAAPTLLPVDLQYTAANLSRLFLKPNAPLAFLKAADKSGVDNSHGEEMLGGALGGNYDGGDDDDVDDHDGWAGDGMGYVGDFGPAESSDVVDEAASELIEQPRRVNKIEVPYARAAKQVDVRALKHILWQRLEFLARLPERNAAGRLQDLSVHLCFICVLHLANEHGLSITGCASMDELVIRNVLP
eukprot:jgi/Chlat1/7153/Chrsp57S06828